MTGIEIALIAASAASSREAVRTKDKQKKAIRGAEIREKAQLAKTDADESEQRSLSKEAPGAQAAARRRRIGLRSLRVDPGISIGGAIGGVGGIGGGLSI